MDTTYYGYGHNSISGAKLCFPLNAHEGLGAHAHFPPDPKIVSIYTITIKCDGADIEAFSVASRTQRVNKAPLEREPCPLRSRRQQVLSKDMQ